MDDGNRSPRARHITRLGSSRIGGRLRPSVVHLARGAGEVGAKRRERACRKDALLEIEVSVWNNEF